MFNTFCRSAHNLIVNTLYFEVAVCVLRIQILLLAEKFDKHLLWATCHGNQFLVGLTTISQSFVSISKDGWGKAGAKSQHGSISRNQKYCVIWKIISHVIDATLRKPCPNHTHTLPIPYTYLTPSMCAPTMPQPCPCPHLAPTLPLACLPQPCSNHAPCPNGASTMPPWSTI